MCINNLYTVSIERYAYNHFIKSFSKKYRNAWETTYIAIDNTLARIDNFLLTSKAEKIHSL
jgi:hypothetical protein